MKMVHKIDDTKSGVFFRTLGTFLPNLLRFRDKTAASGVEEAKGKEERKEIQQCQCRGERCHPVIDFAESDKRGRHESKG